MRGSLEWTCPRLLTQKPFSFVILVLPTYMNFSHCLFAFLQFSVSVRESASFPKCIGGMPTCVSSTGLADGR